jgi:hypothetical protein
MQLSFRQTIKKEAEVKIEFDTGAGVHEAETRTLVAAV